MTLFLDGPQVLASLWDDNHRVARCTLGAGIALGAIVTGSADFAFGTIVSCRTGGTLGPVVAWRALHHNLMPGVGQHVALRTVVAWLDGANFYKDSALLSVSALNGNAARRMIAT